MTEAEERNIERVDKYYIKAVDALRGMRRNSAKLAVKYPAIENSLVEQDRAMAFIKEEWELIHYEIDRSK